MVQQIKSEVLDNRRVGDYHVLSLTAPGIAESCLLYKSPSPRDRKKCALE